MLLRLDCFLFVLGMSPFKFIKAELIGILMSCYLSHTTPITLITVVI